MHTHTLTPFLQTSRSVVRCNCVQPDARSGTRRVNDEHISLYVEFNTSYRLTVEDTRGMPASEKKVSAVTMYVHIWVLSPPVCCRA